MPDNYLESLSGIETLGGVSPSSRGLSLTITLNPYQGLKLFIGVNFDFRGVLTITLNPYQGLKHETQSGNGHQTTTDNYLESLSGIETNSKFPNKEIIQSTDNYLESLSGIETFFHLITVAASTGLTITLNPYQGLKLEL